MFYVVTTASSEDMQFYCSSCSREIPDDCDAECVESVADLLEMFGDCGWERGLRCESCGRVILQPETEDEEEDEE